MTRDDDTLSLTDRPRILLVEDDPPVRRSLQLLLRGKGFDVRAYADGGTLLNDPTIVQAACFVTDLHMDGLDGMELLARLRARGWHGPAVLITGSPTPGLADRAAAQGFSAIIEKPFRASTLTETVQKLTHAA